MTPEPTPEQPPAPDAPQATELVELSRGLWPVLRATVLGLPLGAFNPQTSSDEFVTFMLRVRDGKVIAPVVPVMQEAHDMLGS